MSAFKNFLGKPKEDDPNRPMSEEEQRQWEMDRKVKMAQMEAFETAKARQWLQEKRIVSKSVTGHERREKLIAYMKTVTGLPKPGKEWANKIIKDYEEGIYTHEAGYRLACEAVGHEPIKVEVEVPF
jgi:hypothetical protein